MQATSIFSVRSAFVPPFALITFRSDPGLYLYDEQNTGTIQGITYSPHSISLPSNGLFRPETLLLYGYGSVTAAMVQISMDGQPAQLATLDPRTKTALAGFDRTLITYNIPSNLGPCKEFDVVFTLSGQNIVLRHLDVEYAEVE